MQIKQCPAARQAALPLVFPEIPPPEPKYDIDDILVYRKMDFRVWFERCVRRAQETKKAA